MFESLNQGEQEDSTHRPTWYGQMAAGVMTEMGGHQPIPNRRRWLRHQVHALAFASFDGVTGGMILDLSEQGISMQMAAPLEAHRPIRLH
jgi:hypothetical protein